LNIINAETLEKSDINLANELPNLTANENNQQSLDLPVNESNFLTFDSLNLEYKSESELNNSDISLSINLAQIPTNEFINEQNEKNEINLDHLIKNIQPKQINKTEQITNNFNEVIGKLNLGMPITDTLQITNKLATFITNIAQNYKNTAYIELEPANLGKIMVKLDLAANNLNVKMHCETPYIHNFINNQNHILQQVLASNFSGQINVQIEQQNTNNQQFFSQNFAQSEQKTKQKSEEQSVKKDTDIFAVKHKTRTINMHNNLVDHYI